MGSIKKKVDDHLYLNKESIISYYNDRPRPGSIIYFNEGVMVYMDYSNNTSFLILETGEEFKIPYIMVAALHNLKLDDVIDDYKDRSDTEDVLIMIHYISNLNRYVVDKVVRLLYMMRQNDLLTGEFRDMIYSRLKMIPSHITYSSPYDYQFY